MKNPTTIADLPEDIRDSYLWCEYTWSTYYGLLQHVVDWETGDTHYGGRRCPGCGAQNSAHIQTTYYWGLYCGSCSLKFTHEEADDADWDREHMEVGNGRQDPKANYISGRCKGGS